VACRDRPLHLLIVGWRRFPAQSPLPQQDSVNDHSEI
jgi:hypothetical protein